MIGEQPEAGSLQNTDGKTNISHEGKGDKPFVFHQCFAKGQNYTTCAACSEKEKCLVEA